MARPSFKLFGMSIGGILFLVAVIVGILIATGVIRVKENLTNQVCTVPNITNVEIINNKMRISYNPPIEQGCLQGPLWQWGIFGIQCGGNGGSFTPVAGQSYIDVDAPPKDSKYPDNTPCDWNVNIIMYPEGKQSENYQKSNTFTFTY